MDDAFLFFSTFLSTWTKNINRGPQNNLIIPGEKKESNESINLDFCIPRSEPSKTRNISCATCKWRPAPCFSHHNSFIFCKTTTMSSDNIEQPRQDVNDTAVRFPAWVALAILSFVSFASVVGREHVVTSAENWAITVTLISSILGLIATIGYMYGRGIFLSQLPEVILV